jgi:ATP-dependent Lon protease
MSLKKKFPGPKKPFGFTHNADHVPDLPQYAFFQYSTYHEGDNFRVSLLLPASASMRQAMEERIAAGIAKSNADQVAADLAAEKEAEREDQKPYSFERSRQSAHEKELARSKAELDQKEADQVLERNLHSDKAENSLAVYEVHEPLKLLAGEKTPDKEIKERNKAIFDRLKALGRYRQVHSLGDIPQLLKSLGDLEQEQPHFREVISFIRRCGELALHRKQRMQVPPILLVGGPGVGKTHFTLELARALRRPVERHSMDADHTASTLSGSARHWGNTNTGKVFDAVCLSERADPILLIDEIDKAGGDDNRKDPLHPLLSLLEPVSSTAFPDLSAGITFDASHITWIATANDLRPISLPILSRFRVFVINVPAAQDAIALAEAILRKKHAAMGLEDFREPSRKVAVWLAHLTPRAQLRAFDEAYAGAVAAGRLELTRRDIPMEYLMDEDASSSPLKTLH